MGYTHQARVPRVPVLRDAERVRPAAGFNQRARHGRRPPAVRPVHPPRTQDQHAFPARVAPAPEAKRAVAAKPTRKGPFVSI